MVTRFDKYDEELVEKFGGCWCEKSGEEAVNSIPKDMGGEGNCFYYSTLPPGATHKSHRTNTVKYISTHGDEQISKRYTFRSAIESLGYGLEAYCVNQGKTGQFASPIEIAAFCKEHKKFVPVYSQSPDDESKYLLLWTMGDPSDPVVPLHFKDEHYEAMVEHNDDEGWKRARNGKKASKPEENDGKSVGTTTPNRYASLSWDDDDEADVEEPDEVEVASSIFLSCSFRGGMMVYEDRESDNDNDNDNEESTSAMPSCTTVHPATEALPPSRPLPRVHSLPPTEQLSPPPPSEFLPPPPNGMGERLLCEIQHTVEWLDSSIPGHPAPVPNLLPTPVTDRSRRAEDTMYPVPMQDTDIIQQEDPAVSRILTNALESGLLPRDSERGFLCCFGELKGRCKQKCTLRAMLEYGGAQVTEAFTYAKKLSELVANFKPHPSAPAVIKGRRTEKTYGDGFGRKARMTGSKKNPRSARRLSQEVVIDPAAFKKRLDDIPRPVLMFLSRREAAVVRHLFVYRYSPPPPPTADVLRCNYVPLLSGSGGICLASSFSSFEDGQTSMH